MHHTSERTLISVRLDDLPRYSPWPARLLGLTSWYVQARTPDKVAREYDTEKYGRLLDVCRARGADKELTPKDVKQIELNEIWPGKERIVSRGNQLLLADAALTGFWQEYATLLATEMRDAIKGAEVVIELGSGYGHNLWHLRPHFLDKMWLGGEYSTNAVEIARMLYANTPDVQVSGFDYYDRAYDLLSQMKKPAVVFTSHSIEQLPSAAPFLEGILRHRAAVRDVFHFEPVYELHDDDMLGLLRRRYTEVNDYNRDLLTLLRACREVNIVRTQPALLGLNPLNPTSVIHWQFN